ncbi:MAG TPA: hypothetical protein VJN18_18745 [Polyangiaceae bacterium]|nr:hypothetical protein [Polyangiaceae bacterium]
MAQRKRPRSAPDEQAVRREVVARLESDGVVKLTAVKPVSLRSVLAQELQLQGFEVTTSVIRQPLMAQLEGALTHGAMIPLKSLSSHVRGGSASELKALVSQAVEHGKAQRVLRGRAEVLAGPTAETVARGPLSALREGLGALSKSLEKAAKSRQLVLLADDVIEVLSEALAAVRGRDAASPKHGRDALAALLAAVEQARDASTGLSFVPEVVEKLAPRWEANAVGRLLLSAAQKDLLELRPEGGIGRLSEAELSVCPPGPHGTRLSWARRLGGGRA